MTPEEAAEEILRGSHTTCRACAGHISRNASTDIPDRNLVRLDMFAATYGTRPRYLTRITCEVCNDTGKRPRRQYVLACHSLGQPAPPIPPRTKRFSNIGVEDDVDEQGGSSGGDSDWTIHCVSPLRFQYIRVAPRELPTCMLGADLRFDRTAAKTQNFASKFVGSYGASDVATTLSSYARPRRDHTYIRDQR